MEGLKGSKATHEGNLIAHVGDAIGDAMLFDLDKRTDRGVYRELYGLDAGQVLEFRTYTAFQFNIFCQKLTKCLDSTDDDGGLFLVLNAHATMVAQGKIVPDNVKVAFNSLISQVEENWLQPPNKDHTTPLGSAYCNFWNKYNQQAPPKVMG